MTERINVARVSQIIGRSRRWVQQMASQIAKGRQNWRGLLAQAARNRAQKRTA